MLALHLQSNIIVMAYSQKSINYNKCYSFWGTPCWICINPSLFPLVWFYFKFTLHALLFFLYIRARPGFNFTPINLTQALFNSKVLMFWGKFSFKITIASKLSLFAVF